MVTATSSKDSTAKPAKRAPIRTFDAALRYLYSHTDYEQMLKVRYNRDTFSLARMAALLKQLGDPHWVAIRGLIGINGDMITQAALTRYINKLSPKKAATSEDKPTFLEIFTPI